MEKEHIQKKRRLPFYVPWILLYLVLVGGAVTSAAITYKKYDEHRLPAGYITLSLDKTQYELGEPITFTVELVPRKTESGFSGYAAN